jgi:hypothetical protein
MVTKQVSLPEKLLHDVELRLDSMGIGFPEYVRYLILRDTEEFRAAAFANTPSAEDNDGYRPLPDPSHPSYRRLKSAQVRRKLAGLGGF